jgi:hypothetical protein
MGTMNPSPNAHDAAKAHATAAATNLKVFFMAFLQRACLNALSPLPLLTHQRPDGSGKTGTVGVFCPHVFRKVLRGNPLVSRPPYLPL